MVLDALPPLHIKLEADDFFKNIIVLFMKAMNKESELFKYLREMFSKITEAQIKE